MVKSNTIQIEGANKNISLELFHFIALYCKHDILNVCYC